MTDTPCSVPEVPPRRAAVIAVGLVFFNSLIGQLATLPNSFRVRQPAKTGL